MNGHRPAELEDIERRVPAHPIARPQLKPLTFFVVGCCVLIGLVIWSVGLMTSLRWVLERVG